MLVLKYLSIYQLDVFFTCVGAILWYESVDVTPGDRQKYTDIWRLSCIHHLDSDDVYGTIHTPYLGTFANHRQLQKALANEICSMCKPDFDDEAHLTHAAAAVAAQHRGLSQEHEPVDGGVRDGVRRQHHWHIVSSVLALVQGASRLANADP